MKCKVVKVAVFGFGGKDYKPSEIVDVPKRFTTLDFLEPVPKPKTEAPKKPKN